MPVSSPECHSEWFEPSWENISVSCDPVVKVCSVEHRKKVLDGINIGFPFFVCFLLWSHSRPGLWKLIVGWEFLRHSGERSASNQRHREWAILPATLHEFEVAGAKVEVHHICILLLSLGPCSWHSVTSIPNPQPSARFGHGTHDWGLWFCLMWAAWLKCIRFSATWWPGFWEIFLRVWGRRQKLHSI